MKIFKSEYEVLSAIDKCYSELCIDKNSSDGKQQIEFLKLYYHTSTLNDFIEHFQEFYKCSRDCLDTLYFAYTALDDDTFLLIR